MKKPSKVLIVEDSANDAALLIKALQDGGYNPVYEIVETPEAMADALNRQASFILMTERKRSEDELALRAQLLDNANDSIVLHDFEGRIHYVNEVACGFYGYTREELMQKSVFELHTPEPARDQQNGQVGLAGVLSGISASKRSETELRFSEERFSKAFNACPSPMSISTFPDGRYIDVNESFIQVLGYRREDVINFTRSELNIWEKPEDLEKATQSLSEKKLLRNFETSVRTKSGESRIGLMSAEIIDISGGEYMLLVFEDITKRKQAEEILRQREEQLRQITDNMLDMVAIKDVNGVYQYVSPSYTRVLGYEPEELLGKDVFDLIHPGDRSGAAVFAQQGIDTAKPGKSECRFRHADGHYVWLETIGKPLLDDQGSIGSFIFGSRDITERKEAEEALRQSEERFSRAFHANPCLMVIISLIDYRVIDVNQQLLNAVGISREEVIGRMMAEIDIHSESWFQNMRQALEGHGKVQNHEFVYFNKKGEERYGLWSSDIITINGERCLLGAVIDITERKQYEREMTRLDRLHLVGEMAAGIAHEIRNPMTVIRGYMQLFQENEEFTPYKKRFQTMIGELDRANSIITEYLALAKNKAVHLKMQSLNSIVEAMLPLIQAEAIKNNQSVTIELSDAPDLLLDGNEIRQIILNLARNGLEAMSHNGVLIIRTYLDGPEVVLAMQNEGPEISPAVLEKIGTPFFTTKDNGTGLGMAVCYSIASRHNASIRIETGKRGTSFMVSFPIRA
jgi:PAS domain S-box-containing protein